MIAKVQASSMTVDSGGGVPGPIPRRTWIASGTAASSSRPSTTSDTSAGTAQ